MQFSQLHLKTTVYASLLFMQNLKVKQGGRGVMGDCVIKQCKKMSVYVCINTKGKVKRATKFCNIAAPKRVEQRCCAFLLQTTETNLVTLFVASRSKVSGKTCNIVIQQRCRQVARFFGCLVYLIFICERCTVVINDSATHCKYHRMTSNREDNSLRKQRYFRLCSQAKWIIISLNFIRLLQVFFSSPRHEAIG